MTPLPAAFIAEVGDIGRFPATDFDQLLGLRRHASTRGQLGAQGRQPRNQLAHGQDRQPAPLRAAAHHVALAGIVHNPLIPHLRKREAGKSSMNVLGHCMR